MCLHSEPAGGSWLISAAHIFQLLVLFRTYRLMATVLGDIVGRNFQDGGADSVSQSAEIRREAY